MQNKKSPAGKLYSSSKSMPVNTATVFGFTCSCETELSKSSLPPQKLTLLSDSHSDGCLQDLRKKKKSLSAHFKREIINGTARTIKDSQSFSYEIHPHCMNKP